MGTGKNRVFVVLSGGTIDAQPYAVTPKNITPLSPSIIPETLDKLGIKDKCTCYSWLAKDSKDFTPEELRELARLLRQSGHTRAVIVHGTDRMAENSHFLQKQQQLIGKNTTVIFTGAMVPISNDIAGIASSDGYDNLEFAVEQAKILPPGVYIAFNREVFDPAFTRKDFNTQRFVHTDKPTTL